MVITAVITKANFSTYVFIYFSKNLRTYTFWINSTWLLLNAQCNSFTLHHKFAAGRKTATIVFVNKCYKISFFLFV